MNVRKPGLVFRLWTRTIDVFSPGRGRHRIYSRMQELYAALRDKNDTIAMRDRTIQDLESEVVYLRNELRQAQSKLRLQPQTRTQPRETRPKWASTPPVGGTESTMPIRLVRNDDTTPAVTDAVPENAA